ncbi:MAG: hypothetical protein ABSC48_15335 [Terracidiphilus sp.]|jgi:hypothetical protein
MMSAQTAMSLMAVAEFALWTVFAFLFWTRKLHRRFPAMGSYLALHVAAMPALLFLFYGQARHWYNGYSFDLYFYVYWSVYIVSAVLLFFVCIEVFRSALVPFSGLQRLGTVAFRWAALVSTFLSLSTLSSEHPSIFLIPAISLRLMRSVSILELCLLAFLCLSMNALRLPVRGMTFGISLGFGLMSASDFILASFWSRNTSLTDPLQFVYESLILLSLGIWVGYTALPEPARQPVMIPAKSILFRWNEIATVLGHTGTQVAVQQPASGFSLSDVEKAVAEAMSQRGSRD